MIKADGEEDQIYELFIPQGNYDVFSLRDTIAEKVVVMGTLDIEYDEKLNKFLFKDILLQEGYSVYLKCINSGVFFGMDDGVENLISPEGVYSTRFINVAGYENMIIHIGGEIDIDNSITNIINKVFQQSQILGIIPINDIVPMDSIIYNNADGGINYNYRIHNKIVSYFTLSITNENGVVFPQMSDNLLTLQFSRHSVKNEMLAINKKLDDICVFMTYMMEMSGISPQDDNSPEEDDEE
eukprot:2714829-Rhodomonas_salina.1